MNQHQAIVGLCITSLCESSGNARGFADSDTDFACPVSCQEPAYSSFLFACTCSALAAGMNSLSSFGRHIAVRSSHVTGWSLARHALRHRHIPVRCAAAACVSYRACACCCFIWMVSVTSSFFCRRFGSDCGFFPRHFAGALMFCRHRDAPCAQVTIRHPAVASSAKAQCDPSVSAVTAPKEGLARFCDLIIEY